MKVYSRYGKRIFDLVLAIPAWFALAPLLAVIALFVRVKLGSPVLFRQIRPGLNGRHFSICKFRSMTDERDAAGRFLPDDRRLTPFGRFLRATSLDELPELYNVLKGDMSLVGPRPLRTHYLPLYSAVQARRHEVRPGITGWAQVNGRNDRDWKRRLADDVWYVDHFSLRLDLQILALTVLKVLRREGISAEGHATMPPFKGER